MGNTVTQSEHERITEAIRRAEMSTSGEIFCVVARRSDGYFFSAALIVMSCILGVSLVVGLILEAWWFDIRLPVFVGAQIAAAAAALVLIYAFPALRQRVSPRRWQYMRAHDNALKQFLARNVHLTAQRTGVLIFVSLAERYAEIVADAGINAKVPQDAWNDVVAGLIDHAQNDRLADGFVSAIDSVAKLLATHFPSRPGDVNELDDHLVEL